VITSFGIKTLLLLLAALLFVLAVFSDEDYADLLAWGLASLAVAFLLTDVGWDRRYGRGGRRTDT
jgi:uncharacterized PurR-regulated membrane protein YhhQ (DUF165 family)